MNIFHTIASLGINSGGPPLSTTLAVQGLRAQGVNAKIVTYDCASDNTHMVDEAYAHFLSPPYEDFFGYSRRFRRYLNDHPQDLYHAQGIWQYSSHITAKVARKKHKPYVITPRGMLYPQQLKDGEWHKKLAMRLYQKRDLQQADCIHATCQKEMEHLRNLGITTPVAVIPNPIETGGILEQPVHRPSRMRFGYLGRIHPRKKVERLLYAWERLANQTKNKELVIIGAGDDTYHRFLKNEATRLQLQNVVFTGFLRGMAKQKKMAQLSYLVVPSEFENFGMIIAEALVRGIPVIASRGTPWQNLEKNNCGWWVKNDVDTLQQTMKEAMQLAQTGWWMMAKNGKKLINKKYTVDEVGIMLSNLYRWLLSKKNRPNFVYL